MYLMAARQEADYWRALIRLTSSAGASFIGAGISAAAG